MNLCVPCFSVQAEVIFLSDAPIEKGIFSASEDSGVKEVSFGDTAGHWAENGIKAWAARELVGGYPDGTFRPDSPITRAEFLTLVNRAFGYTAAGQGAGGMNTAVDSSGSFWGAYKDIAVTDWYAGEIAKAAAVGYLGGYPDGTVKPQNPITRQEAAALFAKILPPANFGKDKNKDSNNDTVDSLSDTKVKFVDQAQIPAWSQAAIAAAVNGGYMNGYPNGTFQPAKPITRAEAVAVLERAVGQLYNRAGTYGPFQGTALLEGNVTVNTPGVTLQNTTITGNLYLTEGIGVGDVTLNNVTVQGTTKISGGGSNSIHLLNTSVGAVLVNVP
ncbi:MAG: S-layer homology domain-containing protein, partial [Desulfitobacteriaceae bacterium]|nr:S-layer homology domain-containing protein [Desulfitobacteriaceae bacterium]